MFFRYKFSICVITFSIILNSIIVSDVKAMKRSHDLAESSAQVFQIQDFANGILQRILFMSNKKISGQVCKLWHQLSNFKDNWHGFSTISPQYLSFTENDYIKMYYHLVKSENVRNMEILLSIDQNRGLHFQDFKYYCRYPSQLTQLPEMLDALRQYPDIAVDEPKDEVLPGFRQDKKCEENFFEFNDILLRNDMQALDAFIEAGKELVVFSSELLARCGTLQCIEKVVCAWKRKGNVAAVDRLLYLGVNYVDVVELILSNGYCSKNQSDYNDENIVSTALYEKNYRILELLCKYGIEMSDPEQCHLEKDDKIALHWTDGEDSELRFVSPLIYCIFEHDLTATKILCEYGAADPYQVDDRNTSLGDVLGIAKRFGTPEIVAVIEIARIAEQTIKARLKNITSESSTDA